jgi:uncharacterized membrane protein
MLSADDAKAIEARIRVVEQRTGAQVVVAVVNRANRFHGLRWRAFALGTAIGAIAAVAADVLRPDWTTSHTSILVTMVIVGCGLSSAMLASYWPAFERLLLQHSRAQEGVQRRAIALFLERELFRTPGRNAVLLLAGRFERAVAVLGDTAYRDRIDAAGWQRVADATTAGMREADARAAIVAGLAALESLLAANGFSAGATRGDDLPDAPIELGDAR